MSFIFYYIYSNEIKVNKKCLLNFNHPVHCFYLSNISNNNIKRIELCGDNNILVSTDYNTIMNCNKNNNIDSNNLMIIFNLDLYNYSNKTINLSRIDNLSIYIEMYDSDDNSYITVNTLSSNILAFYNYHNCQISGYGMMLDYCL